MSVAQQHERGAPLLSVTGLRTEFATRGGTVTAVNGVDLELRRGEIVGLVGESGSGKSVTSRSMLRILPSEASITAGTVELDGVDLVALSDKRMADWRGRRIGMIFQEASAALNPLVTVGEQIAEGIRRHHGLSRRAARRRAIELLESVGIPDPARRYSSYPHQLSGGMQQRSMIAVVLGCEPDVLIADEPTTALDVTVQMQILRLLSDQAAERNIGLLLITHNIAAVAQIAHRVAVMYAGRIVETGETAAVIDEPRHPYTAALLAAMPSLHGERTTRLSEIPGGVPDPLSIPSGCPFHPRCPRAFEQCTTDIPTSVEIGLNQDLVTSHQVRCHLYPKAGAGKTTGDDEPSTFVTADAGAGPWTETVVTNDDHLTQQGE